MLNIAGRLAKGNPGDDEDWNALSPVDIRGLQEHLEQWGFSVAYYFTQQGGPGHIKACSERRLNRMRTERSFLWAEMIFWLKVTDVGFALMPETTGKWQLSVDYKRCVLGAVAMQLALTLAGGERLHTCSGCGSVYARTKRPPRPGQANYCDECDKDKIARQRAERRRCDKRAAFLRMHSEGIPKREISERLHTKLKTIDSWIAKLK